MKVCPHCKSAVELFEIACAACGKSVSQVSLPTVSDVAPSKVELNEAYQSWLKHGNDALTQGDLEVAVSSLREAVKRSRTLDDAERHEFCARKPLAEALERLNKIPEAADQYRIISQIATSSTERETWLKRSQDLLAASSTSFDHLFRREDFRPLLEEERRFVPLYCSGCKRFLAEGESFAFRRGATPTVRCWCGIDDRPVVKQDALHVRALEEGKNTQGQRRIAISVAGRELPGGKKRTTACIMAVFLGFAGGHKFYLGDSVLGFIYLLWAWTLVPLVLALYEALILSQMSLVTFNMTYNLDLVLQKIAPHDDLPQTKMEMFSLEAGEGTVQATEDIG